MADNAVTFDISKVADLHYRGTVRLSRWVALGMLLLLGGVVIWHWAAAGFGLIILPVTALLAFLVWVILFYSVRGPITLRADPHSIEFIYRNGRVRQVALGGERLSVRLAEGIPGQVPPRFDLLMKDASQFVIYKRDWIAVSSDAFQFVDAALLAAGYEARLSVRPDYPTAWRIREYDRRPAP